MRRSESDLALGSGTERLPDSLNASEGWKPGRRDRHVGEELNQKALTRRTAWCASGSCPLAEDGGREGALGPGLGL